MPSRYFLLLIFLFSIRLSISDSFFCDIIINPEDILWPRYVTRPLSGDSVGNEIPVIVRNAGAAASGVFDVDLIISEVEGAYSDTLHLRCPGLAAGAEDTLVFSWIVPQTLNSPVDISFHAVADHEQSCPDSWIHNNDAEDIVESMDFYPYEPGWPLKLSGSIKSPPVLCDVDLDGDLEIIAIEGPFFMIAADPDNPSSLLWTVGPYYFSCMNNYTIPVSGDVCGDRHPEIVVDSRDSLLIFSGVRGDLLFSYATGNHPENWSGGLHEICLAELDTVSNDHKEIIILRGDSLYVLGVTGWGGLECFDRQYIPAANFPGGGPEGTAPLMHWWVAAGDMQGSETPELVVSCGWSKQNVGEKTGLYVFEWQNDSLSCIDSLVVEDEFSRAVPALGSLPVSGMSIAISRRTSSANHAPAYILDTDLTLQDSCAHNPSLDSDHILCCLMADWYALLPGMDRIISPAENQCFTWEEDGRHATGWPAVYTDAGQSTPPFPALGNLDNTGFADLVTATMEGVVHAYEEDGDEMTDLDFPYFLPSEVTGGFVIADIDNDGKIELVFGTLDNYLHVWQLGDCTSGYAPWPQCQQNAARTGVLE